MSECNKHWHFWPDSELAKLSFEAKTNMGLGHCPNRDIPYVDQKWQLYSNRIHRMIRILHPKDLGSYMYWDEWRKALAEGSASEEGMAFWTMKIEYAQELENR